MYDVKIGIIGGTGVYQIDGITKVEEVEVTTPFGSPSDKIIIAELSGKRVAFLPRHNRNHIYKPTDVPSKANIYALKSIGVRNIISLSAVGSLQEELKPTDLVIPDQLVDRTFLRSNTYFEDGIVGHISFSEPYCPQLQKVLYEVSTDSKLCDVHKDKTLLCMEGPAFSTKAESNIYRQWNCDIIGMTAIPEAKLAREAEMCYGIIAMVTDYDCWKDEEVTLDMVIKNMNTNTQNIKKILPEIINKLSPEDDCSCLSAAENAIHTKLEFIPDETKRRLNLFYKKYWD